MRSPCSCLTGKEPSPGWSQVVSAVASLEMKTQNFFNPNNANILHQHKTNTTTSGEKDNILIHACRIPVSSSKFLCYFQRSMELADTCKVPSVWKPRRSIHQHQRPRRPALPSRGCGRTMRYLVCVRLQPIYEDTAKLATIFEPSMSRDAAAWT